MQASSSWESSRVLLRIGRGLNPDWTGHPSGLDVMGMVLYDSDQAVPFGSNLYAVPISCLWR